VQLTNSRSPAAPAVSRARSLQPLCASSASAAVTATAPAAAAPQRSRLPALLACAAVACTLTLAPPALAAPLAAVASAGDTAWVLTSTALVLFMSIPGLSLFYAGLVRAKSALSVLFHCFVLVCTGTISWLALGYSLSFAAGSPYVGGLSKAFLAGVTFARNALAALPMYGPAPEKDRL